MQPEVGEFAKVGVSSPICGRIGRAQIGHIVRQAGPPGPDTTAARQTRAQLLGDIYDVLAQMKRVGEVTAASEQDKQAAGRLHKEMGLPVQYALVWVRVLSAL